mgnify:FL=1
MKRTQIVAVFIAISMLTACSGPAEPEEDARPEATVVSILSFPDQDKAYLRAAIDEADLDFEVEIIEVPQNQYEDKAKMMLMAQNATDLIMLDAPNIASYASSDMLEPLNKYWEMDDFSDLTRAMQTSVQWQGKIWAAPLNDATCLLFYNRDIFREAGIAPAKTLEESWTLDRMLQVAMQLTRRDQEGAIIQYGLQPVMFTPDNLVEGMAFTQMLYLWWFGAEILDPKMSAATGYLDSAASLDALNYYRRLYVTDQVAPLHEIPNGFVEGRVAMWITGPWMLGTWRDNYPAFFNSGWGVMPLPRGEQEASPCGSWNIAITKQSKHKQEAWQVVQALTGKRGMEIWCEGTGNLPARVSVAQVAEFSYMKEAYELAMAQLQRTSRTRPVSPVYPEISQALVDCFNSVAFGEAPENALRKAADRIDQALIEDILSQTQKEILP